MNHKPIAKPAGLIHRRSLVQPVARRRINWRAQTSAWLFLLPALLIFAVFTWYPMIITVSYSFQRVSLTGSSSWIGLANYRRMLMDPLFAKAWRNVLDFTVLSLIFGYAAPLCMALMINEMRRMRAVFQLIYYLPTLIPSTVALLIWRQIYAPEGGLLNSLLIELGIAAQPWLQSPSLVKLAMIIILTWSGLGGTALIYIAALHETPVEIYEAAEIDGFNVWQRVRYIALPHLSSRMQALLVLQVIAVVQVFTEPFVLTEGGPANSTLTPVLAVYRIAFLRNDFGLASAWSTTLLAALSLFSLIYLWLGQRRKD